MSDSNSLFGHYDRIAVDAGRFGALGHGDFGGAVVMPPSYVRNEHGGNWMGQKPVPKTPHGVA